ncbi:MAG TPA: TerC family protein [candidate division Zixibacteria bacterium]|jgi:tellurite resistance protein TerC
MMETTASPIFWVGFLALILGLLTMDLVVFHRRPHVVSAGEASRWVAFWIGLAAAFNVFVYFEFGTAKALEFTAGYLVEEALSVDNVFVFLIVFRYFHVPRELQHRVLFFGILGAIILRGIFIWIGATLISQFSWVLYIFGAFLVFTGIKIVAQDEMQVHPERNPVLKLLRRILPITADYMGTRFLVRAGERWFATPLLAVLVVVEATDLVFAVDSIPAIFGITHDPFIVYTSNIFAILGLRALFMLLAGIMDKFHYLKYGLGIVLCFIGVKMLIAWFVHIPIEISLGVVVLLLGGSILLSFLRPVKPAESHGSGPDAGTETPLEE